MWLKLLFNPVAEKLKRMAVTLPVHSQTMFPSFIYLTGQPTHGRDKSISSTWQVFRSPIETGKLHFAEIFPRVYISRCLWTETLRGWIVPRCLRTTYAVGNSLIKENIWAVPAIVLTVLWEKTIKFHFVHRLRLRLDRNSSGTVYKKRHSSKIFVSAVQRVEQSCTVPTFSWITCILRRTLALCLNAIRARLDGGPLRYNSL